MTATPEDHAKTWRDMAHQLTAAQVAELEDIDRRPRHRSAAGRAATLEIARRYVAENALAAVCADVDPPAGAVRVDGWQDDHPQPYRIVVGARRGIDGHHLGVWTTAVQFADGHLDLDRGPPTVNLDEIPCEQGLTAGQARALAAALAEAADEIERWTGTTGLTPHR